MDPAPPPSPQARPEHPSAPDEARVGPLSWPVLWRIPIFVGPPLAILVAALVWMYVRDRELDRLVAQEQCLRVVELEAEILSRELVWATSALLDMAADREVIEFLTARDRRAEVEEEFRRYCEASRVFEQIRILDHSGTEIVRVDWDGQDATVRPPEELQEKAARYYVGRGWNLPRGAVYVSRFDLNIEHGRVEEPWRPVIRLATPCFDRSGRKRGLLVMNYLGADLLKRIRRAAEAAPGWSALVNESGYFLEAPAPASAWAFQFGEPPTFAGRHSTAWAWMSDRPVGVFDVDRTMYTYRHIEIETGHRASADDRIDLDLWAIAAVPHDKLYAGSRHRLGRTAKAGGVLALLLLLTAWRLAWVGTLRRRHERSLERSQGRLRKLSKRLLDVQEAERRRLSRDLHDDIGQLATAMMIDLQRARKLEDPGAKDELIQRAHTGSKQLLDSVRRVSASLRSSEIDDLGFENALRAHLRQITERTDLEVDLTIDVEDDLLSSEVTTHLFRVIQEALSNVLKYAGVDRVSLAVRTSPGLATLVVEDRGRGFDPAVPADGIGLVGMRERVELLGGRFTLVSAPGRGTRIEAEIPLFSTPIETAEVGVL